LDVVDFFPAWEAEIVFYLPRPSHVASPVRGLFYHSRGEFLSLDIFSPLCLSQSEEVFLPQASGLIAGPPLMFLGAVLCV